MQRNTYPRVREGGRWSEWVAAGVRDGTSRRRRESSEHSFDVFVRSSESNEGPHKVQYPSRIRKAVEEAAVDCEFQMIHQ